MTLTEIKRSLTTHGNLAAVALDYLGGIPERLLYHHQHRLRHPWSLYKISLNQMFTGFEDVIERYGRIRDSVSTSDESRQFELLMSSYKNFLYTLREHIDDCYLVFKSLVPPALQQNCRLAQLLDPLAQIVRGKPSSNLVIGTELKGLFSYERETVFAARQKMQLFEAAA